MMETLAGHGVPPAGARRSIVASAVVGPPDRVSAALARYADAGAAQVVFDWPPPFDEQTLDAPAILRRRAGSG